MAGIDLSSFTSLTNNLGELIPSGGELMHGLLVGAAVSTLSKGLQAGGASSLDPLGLFHKDAPAPSAAQVNNPAAVAGPTITASAFASLPPAAQGSILAAGGHIVAG